MEPPIPQNRSEAGSLHALIEAAIESLEIRNANRHRDALLFFGHQKTLLPTRVLEDAILEPVDKTVWMVIALRAGGTREHACFPTYDDIRKTANIASKTTVARAIMVLRATRWLTLCDRRAGNRRYNLFTLHDQPLSLSDVRQIDPGYLQFLQDAQNHYHARVRMIAKGALEALEDEIQTDHGTCSPSDPSTGRREVVQTAQQSVPHCSAVDRVDHPPGPNGTKEPNQNLNPVDKSVQNLVHQKLVHQNLVRQIFDPVSNSASETAPANRIPEDEGHVSGEIAEIPLVYPRRFSAIQCNLAERCLSALSSAQRQPVLDELEGRIRSEQQGMSPLYNDLSFLNSLCNAMKKGEFKANLGVKVYEERTARAAARKQRKQPAESPPAGPDVQVLRQQISSGRGPLDAMRKALGQRRRIGRSTLLDES